MRGCVRDGRALSLGSSNGRSVFSQDEERGGSQLRHSTNLAASRGRAQGRGQARPVQVRPPARMRVIPGAEIQNLNGRGGAYRLRCGGQSRLGVGTPAALTPVLLQELRRACTHFFPVPEFEPSDPPSSSPLVRPGAMDPFTEVRDSAGAVNHDPCGLRDPCPC